MGFTAPSQTNWRSSAFRNEIVAALRERWLAAGNVSSVHMFVEGESAQSAARINQIQNEIESLCTSFCNDGAAGGDYTGLTEIPMWQTTSSTTDNFLFYAMASGQMGWRRQVVKGTWATPGKALLGDLWGPWIFEDMQRALLLLKWVAMPGGWINDGFSQSGHGGTSDPLGTGDPANSRDMAEGAYEADSPTTGDTTRIMAYTSVSWSTGAGFDDIRADIYRQWGNFGNAACPALAKVCSFDLYGLAEAPPWITGIEAEFDNNGEGWIKGQFYKCGHATQEAVGVAKLTLGNDGIPVWVAPPTAETGNERGYQLTDGRVILHAEDAFAWK